MQARLPRTLIGAPSIASTLRYKKKMLLWLMPARPTAAKRKACAAEAAANEGAPVGGSHKRARQEAGGAGPSIPAHSLPAAKESAGSSCGTAAASAAAADGSDRAEGEPKHAAPEQQQEAEVVQWQSTAYTPAAAPSASAAAPAHAVQGPGALQGSERVASSDLALAAEEQAAQGGVGYCMLTFIIRNGLQALKLVRKHADWGQGEVSCEWVCAHE